MEGTQVVIIGAGPSGLVLGLSLARFQIKSVILEKEKVVTTDPRGVYLTGDAVRILYDLGLGHEIHKIGHGRRTFRHPPFEIEVYKVNFHKSSFSEKPFFTMNIGTSDALKQVVPEGLLQSQPKLETALRKEIESSAWCTLRTGCTVIGRSRDDPPIVEYITEDDTRHQIQGQWLVGADGKVGIVRKHFLEPTASIRQEEGIYPYNGTWIAANLKISAPTPQTHPEFPLWNLGYSPDEVYDLFWPEGWHFCCPPGKPTATGRFGPHSDRTWRHELRQEDWNESMDAEALLWDHIMPMITRINDRKGRIFPDPVAYPRDCIKILRCRPFTFTHKVVNRWFHKRTILIGDAAHVFPPFAGQGIASGMRDAHQLAWRLSLFIRCRVPGTGQSGLSENLLKAWELERRRSVDDAAFFSMLNGVMCNEEPSYYRLATLWLHWLLESVPFLPSPPDHQGLVEKRGFTSVEGGFFLKDHNGGARLAQIYVQSSAEQVPILSDRLLHGSKTIFTVLVINTNDDDSQSYEDASIAIRTAAIDSDIISEESIIVFAPHAGRSSAPKTRRTPGKGSNEVFSPASAPKLKEYGQRNCYNGSFLDRLGRSPRFCIVRPDFFLIACAKDINEFVKCLSLLKERIENLDTEENQNLTMANH